MFMAVFEFLIALVAHPWLRILWNEIHIYKTTPSSYWTYQAGEENSKRPFISFDVEYLQQTRNWIRRYAWNAITKHDKENKQEVHQATTFI